MTACLKLLVVVLVCDLFMRGAVRAQEWKPADGPLMTRWAKDVSPQNVHAEYPRPQMARERWMNLNGLWDLTIDDAKSSEKILVPFPPESALSGVMKGGTKFIYRRTFEVPKDWNGQRVLLHFGAVDWESTVEVNGKKFGPHKGGYDAFSYDITDALKKDGPQEIVVSAIDPTDKGEQPRGKQIENPHGIWYTPTSGIWQTVWIEPVSSDNFLASIQLTPNPDTGELLVQTLNGGVQDKSPMIEVVVRDGAEEVGRATAMFDIKVKIANPKLWSPSDPHLYDVTLTMRRGQTTLDSVQSYVGFRKIEVKSDGKFNRLFLNNEPLFQIGLLDQGFWPDGLYTAPTDEALKYDIEITKKLGFNMIRKHTKVEPDRWYYWADKLGILVWQDMVSGFRTGVPHAKWDPVGTYAGTQNTRTPEDAAIYDTELKAMIDHLRNHPSIVMW
ncbi:MAG TPA: glycoside hydrolase family 2 TIM barrel-domain containing protein, partial [Tepidisphaeraceae bacterium]|nr:glycoside hydrolase family 2 TIM barrel-domain containing protein [Tepidisphaeraceae bacterium]